MYKKVAVVTCTNCSMSKLLFAALLGLALSATPSLKINGQWPGGFAGIFTIHADNAIHGWKAHLKFDQPVSSIEVWKAKVVQKLNGGREYVLQNMPWDGDIPAGDDLSIDFNGHISGSQAPSGRVFLEGQGSSGGSSGGSGGGSHHHNTQAPQHHTQAPHTTQKPHSNPITPGHGTHSSNTRYDYGKALGLSILFYDAQRSGKLPSNNPIPWRGDSATKDHGDNGVDLSGGWYDAGDHVKFNLPMASSAHILSWGLLKWKDAYKTSGNLDMMYDMIKWPLDYFLKCWRPTEQVYYAQVGNGGADHAFWGRPEDMTMARPAYKVTASRPGSDVAGITAAALAAGARAFKSKDSSYSGKLLTAAKSLYSFAKDHRGIYSQSIPDAASYYGSSGYDDELCVGAAQLYLATNDAKYLNDAKQFHSGGTPWALSWDDSKIACDLLLYEATKDSSYKGDIDAFVRQYMPGGSVRHTPCGLAWRDQWGSLRYAANAAFVALVAAQDGIGGDSFKSFALSQINYILGDNKQHMSFEIGFGSKYPTKPHHRASSCPNRPAACSWDAFNSGGPNPQLLKGALVGGPDGSDNYADSRNDYVKNEVTCDYNAGFQSALAGLIHFASTNDLPTSNSKC